MRRVRGWIMRFGGLFNKGRKDQELHEELEAHIQMHTEDNLRSGMTPEEARRQAMIKMGGIESTKEACRDQRGLPLLETLWRDLQFGTRMLRKNPGFTTVAVLTLALGIGANTAIFSFVNTILLKPLPYKDPQRLVMLFENNLARNFHKLPIGAPVLGEWRRQTTVFEGISAMAGGEFILTGNGSGEKLQGRLVSANAFSLLGINPVLGRDFAPDEEVDGNHHVILLSSEAWEHRFGSNQDIIGKGLTINGVLCTVIGVMPPRTQFPDQNLDCWLPLAFSTDDLGNRHNHRYNCFGKLKLGATLEQARSEMSTVAKRMESDPQNDGWGAEVFPMHDIVVGDSRQVLLLLLGSVGGVLLIGCANIANLLLARARVRSHEFGIRLALGASSGQIIRQLITESVALSTVGGVAGVGLAFGALKGIIRFTPPNLLHGTDTVTLDGTTLLFTLVVTVVAGILFGLAPALQVANPSLVNRMCETSRGNSSGLHGHRLRSALVVSEVALSLILLVGAGLFIRSFSRLITQDIGFNPEHLVTIGIGLPYKSYPQQQEKERFFSRLLEEVRAVPGGKSAALSYGLPFTGQFNSLATHIRDLPDPKPGDAISADYSQLSPGYFQTMNIPFLAGRDFTDRDCTNTPAVLIVDQTFVKNFHLGTNVIGRHVTVGDGTEDAEIIGLVEDIKRNNLAAAPNGELYRPFRQKCWDRMTLVLRTQQDPSVWIRAVRTELDKIDKDIPMDNVRTVTQLVNSSVSERKLSVQLLTGFASVALFLAAIGIYGVLADNVSQRTQEIGIRMALGAQRSQVLNLVVGEGMRFVMLGVVIGLAGALALSRLIASFLFAVKPFDPATFAGVSLLLVAVSLLASWLPARRATKVDPMVALRHE